MEKNKVTLSILKKFTLDQEGNFTLVRAFSELCQTPEKNIFFGRKIVSRKKKSITSSSRDQPDIQTLTDEYSLFSPNE